VNKSRIDHSRSDNDELFDPLGAGSSPPFLSLSLSLFIHAPSCCTVRDFASYRSAGTETRSARPSVRPYDRVFISIALYNQWQRVLVVAITRPRRSNMSERPRPTQNNNNNNTTTTEARFAPFLPLGHYSTKYSSSS
jgi:hypothetical protein